MSEDDSKQFYGNEMERFSALFGRFLQEEGPSVEWDRIQKLPGDAVKDYASLTAQKDDKVVCNLQSDLREIVNQIANDIFYFHFCNRFAII